MQILHVIPTLDPAYGGPTQALVGLATAQQRAGLDVHVAATLCSGEDESLVEVLGEHSVPLSLIRGCHGSLRTHPDLRRCVCEQVERSDVVHIHTVWEQIQHEAALASQNSGKPYVVRPCGMLGSWALKRHSLTKLLKKRVYLTLRLKRTLNRAAAIHYTTEFEREQTAPLGIHAPAIIEPSGIDLGEFEHLPPRGTFRGRYGVGDRPLIVFLGRIFPGKGLDCLIPALAQVQPRDAVLAVVGPDTTGHKRDVEAMIEQHGLRERVIFTGLLQCADKTSALADADLFCLPSIHENFGLVVVEALAAGTPVVISDQVGIHHQVRAGGVGGVVPREPDLLAREISAWLNDRERLHEASRRARPFVMEHFAWNRIAERWQEHYQRLLQPRD